MNIFVCYPKCTTCQKALKWLKEKQVEVTIRNIKEDKPDRTELEAWYQRSKLPLKRFFNTSGNVYKELKLKDKLPELSEAEQLDLLATDGMLVKRPILVTEETVLVGFKEEEWNSVLGVQ